MNRIILIGNGFDLAHGLKTKYTDFMDWYWRHYTAKAHDMGLTRHKDEYKFVEIRANFDVRLPWEFKSYRDFINFIENKNNEVDKNGIKPEIKLEFKNEFWGHISEKSYLETWIDIENEYYNILKSYPKAENRNERVKKLNAEFCQVKDLLEEYLTEVCGQEIKKIDSIQNAFVSPIRPQEIACLKKKIYMDCLEKESHNCCEYKEKPNEILILNFNYTKTVDRYKVIESKVIDIHGELKNKNNPIIFGYGDELDDDYKEIEKTNDNDFLDNIKSIHYHNTDNYRRLLEFLQDEPYQVFIMGHSCGNSDRTLLNAIFEHENCISIKPFCHQWKDEKAGGIKDNYTELVKNISRNFNDKQKMRDIVVRKEFCTPLVPYQTP